MTKKKLFPLLLIAVLAGCGNEKTQEKVLLDSVIKVHDVVMGYEEKTYAARKDLHLLETKKPVLKDSIDVYVKRLDDNDNVMMDWMNKFNPDFTGKSHNWIMSYLARQKKEVMRVDSQIKSGIYSANNYCDRNK